MRIGFTGHRNRITGELSYIHTLYPDAVWVHGGAEGFDTQVDQYAKEHGITVEVIRPEYDKFPDHVAPLLRNEDIVNGTDLLIACYDGRKTGGTRYTVEYAKRQGKPVKYLSYRNLAWAAVGVKNA